jgi:hypothetical protein
MAEAAGMRRIKLEDPSEGRRRRLEMAKGFTLYQGEGGHEQPRRRAD